MARRATRDTFMYETVGPDTTVRRQVFAGQFVPDHYVAGDDTDKGAFDEAEGPRTVGFGAAPHDYKHNVGVSVEEQVKTREGRRRVKKADVAAAEQGGQANVEAGQEGNAEDVQSGTRNTAPGSPAGPEQLQP